MGAGQDGWVFDLPPGSKPFGQLIHLHNRKNGKRMDFIIDKIYINGHNKLWLYWKRTHGRFILIPKSKNTVNKTNLSNYLKCNLCYFIFAIKSIHNMFPYIKGYHRNISVFLTHFPIFFILANSVAVNMHLPVTCRSKWILQILTQRLFGSLRSGSR